MKSKRSIVLLLVLLIAATAFAASVLNYKEQGGARHVIGGSLDVVSGGDLDVESGGFIKIAGTAITSSATELNKLDGAFVTLAELNILDGVTADANELNLTDGLLATTAELNTMDGITSDVNELNLVDGITPGTVTASKAVIVDASGDITGFRNITATGAIKGLVAMEHVLGLKTITAVETGTTYYVAKTGAGDPNDIILTLPPASAGLIYTVVDANETAVSDVTITAGSGDKINDGSAAASYVHDTDADNYASVTLEAIDATDWVVKSSTGTWANE